MLGAEVRVHVAQVAACNEGRPFFSGRVLQAASAVVAIIETAPSVAILLDELT
jgi:hypothetical protein